MAVGAIPFVDRECDPPVRGFLHVPSSQNGDGIVLTHGAGANCESPLLVALADEFADRRFTVLRCNLPFRQLRPHGPPHPGSASRDQAGLRNAIGALFPHAPGEIFLGGHSYGGRQGSMLMAADPKVAAGLLLLSYPLHPPRNPQQLRTAHFPKLQTPALFVHGTRDGFGTHDEMAAALKLISARTELLPVASAGHELLTKANRETLPREIVDAFLKFFGK